MRISDDCDLVLGDCRTELAHVATGSVDLVVADPPYRLSGEGTTCSGGQRVAVDKGAWDAPAANPEEALAYDLSWLRECRRILKKDGAIWVFGTFHNIFSVGHALALLDYRVINQVTWRKPNPPPNLGCRSFVHSTETAIWAHPHAEGRYAFHYDEMKVENGGTQMTDVWTISAHENEERIHPTQKPLALVDRIVRCSSEPGDLVVDPFAGSGTTGVAALNRGRRFLGIEADKTHHGRAAERLRRVVSWVDDLAPFLGGDQ